MKITFLRFCDQTANLNLLLNNGCRLLALATILFVALFAAPVSGESSADGPGDIWVAFGSDILKINTNEMAVSLRIPNLTEIRRIGIDDSRNTLWAYGNKTLSKFHLNGSLQKTVVVPLPIGTDESLVRLEINPSDGSIWLSVGPSLWKFDSQGSLVTSFVLSRNVQALALDPGRTFLWIATDKKIFRRNATNGVEEIEISLEKDSIKDIDVDLTSGHLWVASDKSIRRCNVTGSVQIQKAFKNAILISSDFASGAWIADNKKLLRINSTGNVIQELTPFNSVEDLGAILALVTDPMDSSIWAANQNKILQVNTQGNIPHSMIFKDSLDLTDRIRDLALSRATVGGSPVINFTAPTVGEIIKTFTPTIEISYSDPENDLNTQTFLLMANETLDLTLTCTVGASSATCVPINPLPKGTNTLSATILDLAGNSSTAEVSFTIVDPSDVDDDGDGTNENEGDCNDSNAGIHPGAVEICNGVDDNCNEAIDEGNVCNQPPVITSSPLLEAIVGELYTYDVDATDPDANTLTYSLITSGPGMTIDPVTGLIQWTPAEAGIQDVEVKATDTGNLFATQSFQITVTKTNRAPTAFDDRYAVRRQRTLTVDVPGVLENDLDPDGDPLTANLVDNATKGVLNFSSDGSFDYTPSVPPPDSTEPVLKFAYDEVFGTTGGSTRTQPVVVDLDQDGVSEIVFTSTGTFSERRLIAVHGDGTRYFSINVFQPTAPNPIVIGDPFSEMAAGDIDNDGYPEIIGVDTHDGSNPSTDIFRRQLIAFEHDGTYKWTSQDVVSDPLVDSTGGFTKPVIANVIGDSSPEIVVAYSAIGPLTPFPGRDFVTVYNNHGQIVWTAFGAGSNGDGLSGNIVVADINLDGNVEILFSDDVFDRNGNLLWSASTCTSCSPRVLDVAVANLDDDPFAEIVYLDQFGNTYAHEHTGARKWGPIANAGTGISGITIGDTDGDGTVEILITRDPNICVISRDGTVLRKIPIPFSPGFSGGSTAIFDLNGDGTPELIHNGPRGPFDTPGRPGALYIFDGPTGTLLHSIQATRSGGAQHIPVVADMDGDGAAEIVTGGINELLHVFEAKNGDWSRSRAVYNQISYHATNVNDNGTIPANQSINWLTPGLNNYRVNIPLPEERNGQDTDIFTCNANDGELDSNSATVTIDILPPNTAPSILSLPLKTASLNLEYLYAVRAVDPDAGEVLTFALPQGPTGMTIESATGVIRWIPDASQSGSHLVAVKVTDSQGEFVFQGFTIQVVGTVTVPNVVNQSQAAAESTIVNAGLIVGTITNSPSDTVPAGDVISQEPAGGASVSLGSPINLVISSGQQAVTVPNVVNQTQATAITSLTSAGLTTGTISTATSATVPAGSVISQDPLAGTSVPMGTAVDLVISTGNVSLENLASIIVNPATPLILVGDTLPFVATGIFNDGTSLNVTPFVTWISATPSVSTISSAGAAIGLSEGSSNISASINNITGNTLLTVAAKTPGDSTPPTAEITSPATNSNVTGPVNIIGTATDTNFLKYDLEIAPAGETNFTLLATGTAPVSSGTLGAFDPTLLLNDIYTVRLIVFDTGGNTKSADAQYQVEGNWKVGLFTLTFTDLSVPLSGLPIVVNRVYDSRDKTTGDFGVGWRLDVQTMRIRTNRVLGTGWVRQQSGATINLLATDEHRVSLMLPDGKVEVFDMVVSPTSGFGALDFTSVISFAPRPGTLGTLEALSNNSLAILNAGLEDELVDDETFNTYDPQLYRYTSVDGMKIEIHRTEGVKKITDANGNILTFGPNGILHSSGEGIVFVRDGLGRITQITDAMGNPQTYQYDSNGDLVTHTDRTDSVTRFKYAAGHYLLEIINPNGVRVTRNEYDSNGRLIATIDPDGNRIEYQHDLVNQVEIQRDPDGSQRIFAYDSRGNIVSETDELGNTTTRVYDSNNFLLSETDPLGNTISFTYDAQGHETSRTNALGNTTNYTYGTNGKISSVTDPLGNTTTFTLDANGNRIQETDAAGNVTLYAYDSRGNLLEKTDPSGHKTRFVYDTGGRRNKVIDAFGHETRIAYNGNGSPITVSTEVTTAQGPRTITYSAQYDANGRVIQVTDPDGNVTATEYDSIGNVTVAVDSMGRRTQFTYNSKNLRTDIVLPDGTSLTSAYDFKGRVTRTADKNGLDVLSSYNAVGNLMKLKFPDQTPENSDDNPAQQLEYDAAKRLTGLVNENGGRISFLYDASGRINRRNDPLGNSTSFTYDVAGRLIKQTDALGHETHSVYDSLNRIAQIILPDGATILRTYDATGNMIAEKDANGNTTQFEYDSLNRLIAVIDAAGARAEYQYDELGRLILHRDANDHETHFEYDARGLLTATVRPLGQRETRTYNAAGLLTAVTDFNGNTTQFVYDDLKRLIEKQFPDGTRAQWTYTLLNHPATMIDARGTTTFTYDVRGRLASRTEPDGRTISYLYDDVNRVTAMTASSGTTLYTYDSAGRLLTATAPDGGITSYQYDPLGNLVRTTHPNGVTETRTYNARSFLTQLLTADSTNNAVTSFLYGHDGMGYRTSVVEGNGRSVSYTYDPVYRLLNEQITPTAGSPRTIAYSYDAAGNRLTRNDSMEGFTSYSYDANDRLLQESLNGIDSIYTYDNNGNRLSLTSGVDKFFYEWDFENRLGGVSQTGSATHSTGYQYDVMGRRVSQIVDGIETRFLVDANRPFAEVVEEYSSTGQTLVSYVLGSNRLSRLSAAGREYYHTDAIGSTRALTNNSATVISTTDYDAFGRILQQSGTSQPFLFAGEQVDPVSNLTYLRARYMDRNTGLFLSTDPFPGLLHNPIMLHRYLYANGNPVNFTDPSGLFSVKEVTISLFIAATLGAAMQGIVAANAPSGLDVKWDGPNVGISASVKSMPLSLGVGFSYYKSAERNGRSTTALHLLLTLGASAFDMGDFANKTPNPNAGALIPFAQIIVGSQLLPFDLQIGDATLGSPSLIPGERLPSAIDPSVLSGFYSQLSLAAGGGIFASALNTLTGGDLKNTVGVSGVIQGFGLGVSIPDISLTLTPSVNLSLTSGFSIDLTPDEWINQPATPK